MAPFVHGGAATRPPTLAVLLVLVGGVLIVGFAGLHLPPSVSAVEECNPPPPGSSCSYFAVWNLAPVPQLAADLAALAAGVVVLLGAVLLWRRPGRHGTLGAVVVLAAGISAVGYGGAIVGLLLGGIGGLLAMSHRPSRPGQMAAWDAGAPTTEAPPAPTGAPEPAPPRPLEPATGGLNPLLRPWDASAPDELPPVPWPPAEEGASRLSDAPTIPPALGRSYASMPLARSGGIGRPAAPARAEAATPPPSPTTPVQESLPPAAPRPPLPGLPGATRHRPRPISAAAVPRPPTAAAPVPAPPPPPPPTAAPPPAPPAGSGEAPGKRRAWQCAHCGLVNAPWSFHCTRCKSTGPEQ